MPHDPQLVAATRAWFLKAEEDMAVADVGLRSTRLMANAVTFHAQQAAEKAMKGLLTWHRVEFRKTHLLDELGKQCCAIDSTLETLLRTAVPLTEYAWKSRYPGDWSEPTRQEALEAVRLAQAVFSAILERLPAEVRPY